jgi:hypothetical protein
MRTLRRRHEQCAVRRASHVPDKPTLTRGRAAEISCAGGNREIVQFTNDGRPVMDLLGGTAESPRVANGFSQKRPLAQERVQLHKYVTFQAEL